MSDFAVAFDQPPRVLSRIADSQTLKRKSPQDLSHGVEDESGSNHHEPTMPAWTFLAMSLVTIRMAGNFQRLYPFTSAVSVPLDTDDHVADDERRENSTNRLRAT